MTREEVKAVLANLIGDKWLMASIMYGVALRLTECLAYGCRTSIFLATRFSSATARARKTITMLPESSKVPLQDHLKKVKAVHQKDMADRWGCVLLSNALTASTPTRRRIGAGSGCFHRNTGGSIPRHRNKVAIIWTNRWCRKPSKTLLPREVS
jgi:hypothetical protein